MFFNIHLWYDFTLTFIKIKIFSRLSRTTVTFFLITDYECLCPITCLFLYSYFVLLFNKIKKNWKNLGERLSSKRKLSVITQHFDHLVVTDLLDFVESRRDLVGRVILSRRHTVLGSIGVLERCRLFWLCLVYSLTLRLGFEGYCYGRKFKCIRRKLC